MITRISTRDARYPIGSGHGSDATRDLSTRTRILDESLTDSSEDELARLYHRNARGIYRLSNC